MNMYHARMGQAALASYAARARAPSAPDALRMRRAVMTATAIDAYDALQRLLLSGGATPNIARSLMDRVRSLATGGAGLAVVAPATATTPNVRPVFELPIFRLRHPVGVVGWLLGGRRVQILASVPERNAAFVRNVDPAIGGPDAAHAYDVGAPVEGWMQLDWLRPLGLIGADARVGQGFVDAALRLAQAQEAQVQRARAIQKAPGRGLGLGLGDARLPSGDLARASRRVQVSTPARPPTRDELLAKYNVIEGRAVVERPRGIQIWSAPIAAYRPGTGIHLMERLFVMPQGTRVFLTPDQNLVDAVLNNDANGATTSGSYRVQWSVVGDPIASVFQALGIPQSGVAWARPFAGDDGPYFRKLAPFDPGRVT